MLNFTKEDFPDADVVLKTDDGTLLHAHRLILQIASPFFKDMFTLPQPPADSSKSHMSVDRSDASPIIIIQEDGETMRQLLTLIYPCPPYIRIQDMTLARQVHLLATARKYIFEAVVLKIADNLSERAQRVPSDAFTIYAVGRVLSLDELVRAASANCFKLPVSQLEVQIGQEVTDKSPSNDPEYSSSSIERRGLQSVLTRFSIRDYQNLLKFSWQRVAAIKQLTGHSGLSSYDSRSQNFCRFNCKDPSEQCLYQIATSIDDFLKNGLDTYGPNLELLLDVKFLFNHYSKMDTLCAPCTRAVTNGTYRADIEKFVKEQTERLPRFEITT